MKKAISILFSLAAMGAIIASVILFFEDFSSMEPPPPDYVGEDARGWALLILIVPLTLFPIPFFSLLHKINAFSSNKPFWAVVAVLHDIPVALFFIAISPDLFSGEISLYDSCCAVLSILGIASVILTVPASKN